MYPIKKAVVCLDLTETDDKLISYTDFLHSFVGFETITFIHVMQTFDLPEELRKELPDLEEPLDDILRDNIKEKLDNLLGKDILKRSEVIIGEGDTAQEIAQHIYDEKPDLVIVGKKTESEGDGIVTSRLLKLSGSSVLFVPEKAKHKIGSILTAIDFSKSSQKAFNRSEMLSRIFKANMSCLYVYNLPLSYFPHKPHDKFENSMQKYGKKEFDKFLEKLGKEENCCDCKFLLDEEGKPVKLIYNEAKSISAGLIVIGGRGVSTASTTLVSSISEKITSFENDIPVLVVKDKRETPGFIRSIFEGREK